MIKNIAIWKTTGLTVLALVAFAANSVLCRLALREGEADAVGFTAVRFASGAVVLWAFLWLSGSTPRAKLTRKQITGVVGLALYALAFSLAYLWLDAGLGALILFATVQLTMIIAAVLSGSTLRPLEWLGSAVACAGLVLLLLPGTGQVSVAGAVIMAVAGIGWGLYTLAGRGAQQPLAATALNFLWVLPVILLTALAFQSSLQLSPTGLVYALLSGVLASAAGYAIWYAALAGLSAMQAGVVQLSVPVLAAVGGVIWLAEPFSLHLAVSMLLTLGGIALVFAARSRQSR